MHLFFMWRCLCCGGTVPYVLISILRIEVLMICIYVQMILGPPIKVNNYYMTFSLTQLLSIENSTAESKSRAILSTDISDLATLNVMYIHNNVNSLNAHAVLD